MEIPDSQDNQDIDMDETEAIEAPLEAPKTPAQPINVPGARIRTLAVQPTERRKRNAEAAGLLPALFNFQYKEGRRTRFPRRFTTPKEAL